MSAIVDFLRGTGQWGGAQPARGGSGARTPVGGGAPAVQDWLPVADIDRGLIVRSDGVLVAAVRVEPAPFGLLSDRERERRIGALHEAIQALPGAVQIAVVPRPIDLDAYLRDLEGRLPEADGNRRTLLRGYLSYVRGLVGGGEALERRFYVLIPANAQGGSRRGAREELTQRAVEFVAALGRAELQAHLCDDREIIDLLFTWLHPAQAAFERPADPVPAPRYMPAEVMPDAPR